MPELTDPDDDGILEFTQTVEDVDGDYLSVTGELDQIDGNTQTGSDRDPGWFSFTTSSSLSGSTRTVDVNVEIEASELGEAGTTYTFEFYADDGKTESTCAFTLYVERGQLFNGIKMYVCENNIEEHSLSTEWDISTANKTTTKDASSDLSEGLDFRPDGKKMYDIRRNPAEIFEYDLSTAWDLDTASLNQSKEFEPTLEYNRGITFKYDDGKKLYVPEYGNDSIVSYELSTGWDISTASQLNTWSLGSGAPYGIHIVKEGGKIYFYQRGEGIKEYTLTTPYDITTATFEYTLDISSFDSNERAEDVFMGKQGSKFYWISNITDAVREYDLSTSYDLSTASFVQEKTEYTNNGIHFGGA